jgi:hypothetical protein
MAGRRGRKDSGDGFEGLMDSGVSGESHYATYVYELYLVTSSGG